MRVFPSRIVRGGGLASYGLNPMRLGVMGDSNSDAYRGTDNRGGAFSATTFNWLELLIRLRPDRFIVGDWGVFAEPRRTDYSTNWARTGESAGDQFNGGVNSFIDLKQHTSLADQVAVGAVDLAICWIGTNDYAFFNNTYPDIYNSVTTGANLTTKEQSILDNIDLACRTVLNAGNVNLVLFNVSDPGPWVAAGYPDPAKRQLVTDSVVRVNDGINTIISNLGSRVALANWFQFYGDIFNYYAGVPYDYYVIDGITIDMNGVNNDPHYMVMADSHIGTVTMGIIANLYVIDILNTAWGHNVPRLTNSQLLRAAGL